MMYLHICQVTCICWVTPAFWYFHLHRKFSLASTRIMLKSPAITFISFDGNKIAQQIFSQEEKKKIGHTSIQM